MTAQAPSIAEGSSRSAALTGAAAVAHVVADAGIDIAFGLPGGKAGLIFDEIHRQGRMRFVLVRHEQAATIMADVYGRLTGLPGIAVAQGVFMGSSGAFGIMEAATSSSPMLALADTSDGPGFAQHAIYQNGTGDYGAIDLPQIFRGMTKYFAYATTSKEAVHATQLGLKHAVAGRPGPSVVLARAAALEGPLVDDGKPPFIRPTASYLGRTESWADPAAVARAATAIALARRPAIIAGNGVHIGRAHDALRRFAHRLGAPVATSAKGRSAMSDTDELSMGIMGTMGRDDANRAVAESDLVIVVGCKLSPITTRRHTKELIDPERQTLVQIDVEARNAGWTFPVDHALIGDAAAVLGQLLLSLEGHLADEKREPWFVSGAQPEPSRSDGSPLPPRRIVEVLNDTLPADTLLTLDAGKNRIFTMHGYRARQAGSMIVPGGLAGMGWAAPAVVAAKLIRPGRPCVAVAGDGGFTMTAHVLATAVQYDVPAIFLVMNDSALGWSRDNRPDIPHVTEFSPVDFVTVARGFGADGVRVKDAAGLASAVGHALRASKPFVIDVATDREASHFEIYKA
jgi:acetolactate synthase I/II/III large subunit